MKLIVMTDTNVVRAIYNQIYDATIYPEGERVVHSNGKIENIGDNYILVEEHIPAVIGEQLDESIREYDQSHRYIYMDFKTKVKEAVEEVKDLFDCDKDNEEK